MDLRPNDKVIYYKRLKSAYNFKQIPAKVLEVRVRSDRVKIKYNVDNDPTRPVIRVIPLEYVQKIKPEKEISHG